MSLLNPLRRGPTVLVTAVGEAEGSRGAAAALACEGSDLDRASLLVEVEGRPPRPTLLASAAARALEERLSAHLPELRVAARGQLCQLAVPEGEVGLAAASSAVSVARGALAVVHLPPAQFQPALGGTDLRPSAVLLRADLERDRALVSLAVGDLMERDLAVGVLKSRLGWLSERRALFGALTPGRASSALPPRLVERLAITANRDMAEIREPGSEEPLTEAAR